MKVYVKKKLTKRNIIICILKTIQFLILCIPIVFIGLLFVPVQALMFILLIPSMIVCLIDKEYIIGIDDFEHFCFQWIFIYNGWCEELFNMTHDEENTEILTM